MNSHTDGAAERVRSVMEEYVDAVYRADVDALRHLFHPGALMAGYLGEELLVGTPEPFLADIGGHPSMAKAGDPYRADITGVEAQGRAATATLTETGFFGTNRFVNYFALIEVEERWKIVSKTFASL